MATVLVPKLAMVMESELARVSARRWAVVWAEGWA